MSWVQLSGWEAATEALAALMRLLLVGLVVAGAVGYGGILAYRAWESTTSSAPRPGRLKSRRHPGRTYSDSTIEAEVERGVADIERYLARWARSRRREP